MHTKYFDGVKVAYMRFVLFVRVKVFRKKKKKRPEITLIPSIYTTTENFKLIYLSFYEQISRAQKHSQENINQQNKNKLTLNNKGNDFSCAQTSKRLKVACLAF